MFQLVHQTIEKPEFKQFIESKKTSYVFKDYDAGDFDLLIELWCFVDAMDSFNYSFEVETLQEVYKFKQNPIFIEGIPNDKDIKKMLENVYRSISNCPLISKLKHEKFLYDFCTLNGDSLKKHRLQDEDYMKIAFGLLFGENQLYYNLTYLSLISTLSTDESIVKKITDAMRFIHYCIFCLEDDENSIELSEDDDKEVISFVIGENNGSISLQKISFK